MENLGLLIFLVGFIGFWLAIFKPAWLVGVPLKYRTRLKGIIISLIIALVGFIVTVTFAPKTENSNPNPQVTKTEKTEEQKQEEAAAKEKENIIKAIKEVKDVNSVEINQNYGETPGKYIVLVRGKLPDAFSPKKDGLYRTMQILQAGYQSSNDIASMTVFLEAKLVDKYGQESVATVMKTTLDSTTAKKINWKNLYFENIPAIANQFWASQALNK